MKIQLKNWKVRNLNFSLLEGEIKDQENMFDLETSNYFSERVDDNFFDVGFILKINDQAFDLLVEAIFHFEILDDIVTDEFKLSSFPKVNAPAIAFPYLRAYISNLTLQSGLEPIILPSINFVRMAKNRSTETDKY